MVETDIDVLNAGLYRAVKDGYIELANCTDPDCNCREPNSSLGSVCYCLTESGCARAEVLRMANGLSWDDFDDHMAVAISLVAYGGVWVK